MQTVDAVLNGLMRRYKERVPDVQAILDTMIRAGVIETADDIENDHIAFRTMGVPLLGIQSLEKIFTHFGYQREDYYHFSAKKLDAYWYSPPTADLPRIFISELRVRDLSYEAQAIIRTYTDEVTADPVLAIDLDDGAAVDRFLHSPLWRLPSRQDFLRLQEESEYAAWGIYNRYYLNHYTVSVHNLPDGYNTIADFNVFLKQNGFKLNSSGGEAKKSADGLLIQSSTVAEMITVPFADGDEHLISGSYVEFAERKVKPEYADLPLAKIGREMRRDGFEAANADKIFESTYSEQTNKRKI